MPTPPSGTRRSPGRFLANTPRKVALVAILAAVLVLMIGAGFASMSASGAATPLETAVVRWTALGLLAISALSYVIGSRKLRDGGG